MQTTSEGIVASEQEENTVLVWVRFCTYSPVDFTISRSANVCKLAEMVLNECLVGLFDYKGPIDLYESVHGRRLSPWLKISSIEVITFNHPLLVKVPPSRKVCG